MFDSTNCSSVCSRSAYLGRSLCENRGTDQNRGIDQRQILLDWFEPASEHWTPANRLALTDLAFKELAFTDDAPSRPVFHEADPSAQVRIDALRRQIASGTYLTPTKLRIAIDRLMADIDVR